jgi:hypothetical protein
LFEMPPRLGLRVDNKKRAGAWMQKHPDPDPRISHREVLQLRTLTRGARWPHWMQPLQSLNNSSFGRRNWTKRAPAVAGDHPEAANDSSKRGEAAKLTEVYLSSSLHNEDCYVTTVLFCLFTTETTSQPWTHGPWPTFPLPPFWSLGWKILNETRF